MFEQIKHVIAPRGTRRGNAIKSVLFNDRGLRDYIFNTETERRLLWVDKLGEANPGRLFYYIDWASRDGFCAVLNRIIKLLCAADSFGVTPAIRIPNDIFLYAEKKNVYINGSNNPWEYFFEQPGGVAVEEVEKSCNVIRANGNLFAHEFEAKEGTVHAYRTSEHDMNVMVRLARKYIRMKQELVLQYEEGFERYGLDFEHEKILGVHYRGTDFKKNYRHHPVMITIDQSIDSCKKLMQEYDFDKIFLATDDDAALAKFQNEFKGKIISYQDVHRSDGNEFIALKEFSEKNSRYQLGYEVLRDVVTLSKCSGLIAGMSQVSLTARIFNRAFEKKYVKQMSLNRGFNKSGEICTNAKKK